MNHEPEVHPAGRPPDCSARIQRVVAWWQELWLGGDAGATKWEVLETISDQVTQCLSEQPPNILKAESLTAKAALLIEGGIAL